MKDRSTWFVRARAQRGKEEEKRSWFLDTFSGKQLWHWKIGSQRDKVRERKVFSPHTVCSLCSDTRPKEIIPEEIIIMIISLFKRKA